MPRESTMSQSAKCRPAFWVFLLVLVATSLVRQSEATQLVLNGDTYLSLQFLALLPFALMSLPSLVLRLWGSAPLSLIVGGPLFFVYAVAMDWLRGGGRFIALTIDSAHVLIPILVAIGLFCSQSARARHQMTKVLVVTLTLIAIIYGAVALLVHSLEFGDLVTSRPPGHENMMFVRLSGPLGVSTGLSMILLPAMAVCWQEGRRRKRFSALWLSAAALNGFFILWTASRLSPFFLLALLLFAYSARRIVLLACIALAGALLLGVPDMLIPEKWMRLGISDPGRSMALETTWAAFTSGWSSAFVGVGSDRLNILSQTVAQVARGEIHFNSWNTEFGDFPYGPHSVLLWSIGSYGVLGALFRCAPFVAPWWRTIITHIRSGLPISRMPLSLFAALVSSLGFFFDDTHITHPYLVAVWFLMCFNAFDDLKRIAVPANASLRDERYELTTAALAV